MFTYTEKITNQFFSFSEGEITIQEFQKWIYETEELLEVLGEDKYSKLLSVFFNGIFVKDDLEDLIENFYSESKIGINNEKLIWILEAMIEGRYDVVTGCAVLASLRSFEKGYDFIPIELVGYDSLIEDMVYRYKADKDKAEMNRVIDLYKIEITKIAKNILSSIYTNPNILHGV
ncbi:hypothetical protein [Tepidibacter mesophilus]|uniref:hypothetical protein n=1 Tax=Tepidibacter mesophilus TaxID=655607 RepID=UPI000C07BBE1|nr:hypothetical protein [Tepidibacter mesophilus]